MLTIAQIATETTDVQNDVTPTDAEISKRVLRIRNGWTLEERIARRRDARRRFDDLLDALVSAEAA